MADAPTGPQAACTTFIEQTKLLVTLASAFVLAPAAVIPFLSGKDTLLSVVAFLPWLLWAEGFFICSVLAGYVGLATIAGWQHLNRFDVNRPATMYAGRIQIVGYLLGLALFVRFLELIIRATPTVLVLPK